MQNRSIPIPFIPQRADPYILHHDDLFYFTASVPAYDKIILRCASSLLGLASAEEHTIWEKHDSGIMSKHIWAPELHNIDGIWYVYFAAGSVEDIWAIRPYVLRCTGSVPIRDPWVELGTPSAKELFSFQDFSLDMTTFSVGGKRYNIWAEKVNQGKKISNLYIAEMASPTELKSEQVLLSTPDYDWERVDFWVNEGPAVIIRDEKIFVTYSASATGACYCMGMLSANISDDLLDPASWKKSRYPVLKTDPEAGLYGPGHNSFFPDDSGNLIMAYHARTYEKIEGDPLYDPNRHTFLMRVEFRNDKPIFDFKNNLILQEEKS